MFERVKNEVGKSRGFAFRMRTTDWHDLIDNPTLFSELARLAKTYRITDDWDLCNLALRLAFCPDSVKFETRIELLLP